MKIVFLGQAGLLFEKDGFKIMIDPYLSNSVEKINPKNYRKVAVNESFFDVKPDIMIFTHIGDLAVGEDVADAVYYFAAFARNTTGAELVVDGGNTIQLYPIIPEKQEE